MLRKLLTNLMGAWELLTHHHLMASYLVPGFISYLYTASA